jgi:hypothetical protein
MNDVELYEAGYNRVYDTLEPEQNLDHVELVMEEVLGKWDPQQIMCSWRLNRAIGEHLKHHAKGRGILKSAYQKNVPVFVPAFTDSEMGLDVALNNRMRARDGKPQLRYDPFLDLNYFAETLLAQTKLGILTIGGGVPRNWAQQFGPYCELRVRRAGEDVPLKRYHYGVRVCPERCIGAGCQARLIARPSPGASSSRRQKADALARYSWTPRSDCRSCALHCLRGWGRGTRRLGSRRSRRSPELPESGNCQNWENLTADQRGCTRITQGSSYSKIKIAEAITVVHLPRLSPTPLCVTLVVRTILLEMR